MVDASRPAINDLDEEAKAHLDRPTDRADLAAARLDPDARAWLAATLDKLGHPSWSQLLNLAAMS